MTSFFKINPCLILENGSIFKVLFVIGRYSIQLNNSTFLTKTLSVEGGGRDLDKIAEINLSSSLVNLQNLSFEPKKGSVRGAVLNEVLIGWPNKY